MNQLNTADWKDLHSGPVVEILPSMQGMRIWSLDGEVRAHVPRDENIKQKQHCDKFSKDFKEVLTKYQQDLKKKSSWLETE